MKIAMWTNRMRFDQLEYSKNSPVVKESTFKIFDVPNLQESRTFAIKQSILERDDNLMIAIESVTVKEEEFFDFIERPMRSRPTLIPDYNSKLRLEFSLSSDANFIQRDVYNSFMLLGDIGGFSGLLFSAGAIIVGLFTHNNPQNYLTRKLFTQNDQNVDKTSSNADSKQNDKKLDP